MKVVFTSFPATGHLLPMVPLARVAHSTGDEVLILAGEDQRTLAAGLPFRASGPSMNQLLAESTRRTNTNLLDEDVVASQEAGVQMFTSLRAELSLDAWCDAVRDFQPDLMVAEIWDYVGPLVASRLDIPLATFSHSPATLIDDPLAAGSRATFEHYGLAPPRPLAVVQQWPDWLQPPNYTTAPDELAIGFAQRENAKAALSTSRRPAVLVTLGTAAPSRSILQRVVASALETDARLVVTALTGDSPEDYEFDVERVSVVGFTPLDQLLTATTAVVAAGGSGTTLASLRRGRPIVFVPQFANQPVIAKAVEQYGAGIVCNQPAEVGRSLAQLLDDTSYFNAANRAADALARRPTPTEVWASLRTH